MALIACPDCHREISTEAVACPQCGRPMEKSTPKTFWEGLQNGLDGKPSPPVQSSFAGTSPDRIAVGIVIGIVVLLLLVPLWWIVFRDATIINAVQSAASGQPSSVPRSPTAP